MRIHIFTFIMNFIAVIHFSTVKNRTDYGSKTKDFHGSSFHRHFTRYLDNNILEDSGYVPFKISACVIFPEIYFI